LRLLRVAFDLGKITAGVAEAAARLPESHPEQARTAARGGQPVEPCYLRDVARVRTAAANSELPSGLFEEREGAWQVTVRGHLAAALCVIPDGAYDVLQRAIGGAAAVLETVEAGDRRLAGLREHLVRSPWSQSYAPARSGYVPAKPLMAGTLSAPVEPISFRVPLR
jgi:hypothetical protein